MEELWPLEVTVISARDLKDVRTILKMNPFVDASLLNDQGPIEGQQRSTPADRKGGTSPCWNHTFAPPFAVDVAAALDGRVTLKLEIKTDRTFKNPKDIGWVDVPVQELLEQGGVGGPWEKSFPVRLHSGGTKGILELLYKFGEASTVPGAPPDQQPPDQQPPDQQPPKKGKGWVGGAIIANVIWDNIWDAIRDAEDM